MAHRFIRKKAHNKFVRTFPSTNAVYRVVEKKTTTPVEDNVDAMAAVEPAVPEILPVNEVVEQEPVAEKPKKKRAPRKKKKTEDETINEEKEEADMDNIEKIKKLVGDNEVEIPEQKVRVEKKDKGLFERTENSTILLTEDNKMVLND